MPESLRFRDYLTALKKKSAEIDLSVVCPVATNVTQPEKINELSVKANEKWMKQRCLTLVPFIPDCENYKEIIDDIASMELKGN